MTSSTQPESDPGVRADGAPEPAKPAAPRKGFAIPGWAPKVFLESALVVFSVLLALVLNDWRQQADERKRAAVAVEAVRAEIAENHRLISQAQAYHDNLVILLQEAEAAGAATPDLEQMPRGLFAPASVLDAAWESAQAAELTSQLPYATVLELSAVYAHQEQYSQINAALMQSLYDQLLTDGLDAVAANYPNFTRILRDSASRERNLTAEYEAALEMLAAE